MENRVYHVVGASMCISSRTKLTTRICSRDNWNHSVGTPLLVVPIRSLQPNLERSRTRHARGCPGLLRWQTSRCLRILAKYEEACSIFGPFRVLTARWSEKNKQTSRYTVHGLIFWAFSLFYQDYTKRDGTISIVAHLLGPNLSTFSQS